MATAARGRMMRSMAGMAMGVCVIGLCACTNMANPAFEKNPLAAVAQADLVYTAPAARSEAGLPIGNGRMGTLLWTSPAALQMEINRVDVFGVDRDTTSFPERHTDYCGGCGFVDLDFGGQVFDTKNFRQTLSVTDGLATTSGAGVSVRALALNDRDVIALEVTDSRAQPRPITVCLRMLRPPVEKRFAHTATSKLVEQNGRAYLTQAFEERNYYCGSMVGAGVTGRPSQVEREGDREIRVVVPAGKGTFTVYVSSAGTMQRKTDLLAEGAELLKNVRNFAASYADNAAWWKNFWSKSRIQLHSADGVADKLQVNYDYYLYLMACTSRGDYPTKFNGMLWTTGGDLRKWGMQYWGANQSCLYNTALLAANHVELTDPMFDMYSRVLPSLEEAAREQWGSEGAFVPETMAFNGLAPLPPDIAEEMRALYLMRKPWSEMSNRFYNYAGERLAYSSRWNWIGPGKWVDGKWTFTERSASPFGPVTHTFARGAKIGYEYWNRYEYTGDQTFLKEQAYPFIKDMAEFYRHFPNLWKESDGLYHIHHVNSNEALWDGTDTDEEISGMRGILPVAIRASEILDVDAESRAGWKDLLEHLAPLPRSDNPRVIANALTPPRGAPNGGPVWVKGIPKASHGKSTGLPDGNTLAEWFFDLCTLDSNPGIRAVANNTFDAMTTPSSRAQRRQSPAEARAGRADSDYATTEPAVGTGAPPSTRPAASRPTTRRAADNQRHVGVLSKIPLAAALLGRADAVQKLIPDQSFSPEVPALANRMDLREGPQTTSAQRLGNAADALQNALCQSVPPGPGQAAAIRLFPAWPAKWDAEFTLRERGGFMVSGKIKNGIIGAVTIRSMLGGECRVHNPWPGKDVRVLRNGKIDSSATMGRNGMLAIETQTRDVVVLTP